jgi:hypothetical protein
MSERRDPLLAAALLVAAWGEQIAGGREHLGAHIALAALMVLPLGFARRRPWLPAVACAAGLVGYGAIGSEPDATGEIFALAGAAFVAGSRLPLRGALFAALLLAVAGAVHLLQLGAIGDILFIVGIFILPPVLLGRAVRDRRRRIDELETLNRELTEQRELTGQLAAAAERNRITRDIEGLIAAGLDVMVEEARRGEELAETEAAMAGQAFERIRSTGAEATAELRRLLRLMHS